MKEPEVFYIEDNPADILLLKSALKISGFPLQITIAGDGVQAVDIIETRQKARKPFPDVILLDLNLPKMSGYDVLRFLKQNSKFENLRIIIFTGSGNPEDRALCLSLKADDYWRKPRDLPEAIEIAERLRSLLNP